QGTACSEVGVILMSLNSTSRKATLFELGSSMAELVNSS
ncbi:MAG: hypothetical protein ACI9XZ_003424, partial [Alphaproteobacteria bacterium]